MSARYQHRLLLYRMHHCLRKTEHATMTAALACWQRRGEAPLPLSWWIKAVATLPETERPEWR